MSARRVLKSSAGYLIAAACLAWLLHDVRLSEIAGYLAGARWRWIALALAFDVLSYACQGWRWKLLLEPLGPISVFRATQAIYAGLFTNEVLPMRAGELVRAGVVAGRLHVRLDAVAASILVERLLDAAWLALAIGITAFLVPLPRNLVRAGDVLGAAALGFTILILYFVIRAPMPGGRIGRLLQSVRDGLRGIGLSRRLLLAGFASLLVLMAQALAMWLVMKSYGLPLSIWAGTAVLLIVHAGTAIPNAPANVGSYQFFCVLGLRLFGVAKP